MTEKPVVEGINPLNELKDSLDLMHAIMDVLIDVEKGSVDHIIGTERVTNIFDEYRNQKGINDEKSGDIIVGFENFTVDNAKDQMTLTLNVYSYSNDFGIGKYKTVYDEIRKFLLKNGLMTNL